MPTRRIRRRILSEAPVHLLLAVSSVSILFLFYYLASNALKPKAEYYVSEFALPQSLSLDAILSAINQGNMLVALRSAVILTAAATLVSVFFGACAAYAFAQLRLRWKTAIFVAMLIPMSISPLIVSIPLFAQFARIGLINTLTGGTVIYVGLQISFAIYVLDGVFRQIPEEVIEAARIDGAKPMRIFFVVVLPMALPGLAATALFVMLGVWNDLLVGLLFINDPATIPITANVVTFQQKFSTDPQIIFAGLFMAALPMLIIYGLAQRYFVRGLGGAFR
ncbi:MAG: carbohydrate ABC transporter permease [Parvibaculaceae bacterium]